MPEPTGELVHPGFISDWRQSEKVRSLRTFEKYRPFMHTDRLSQKETRDFEGFLTRLYQLSGDCWEPTCCGSVLSLERDARKILSCGDYQQWVIRARRFARIHYWLDLSMGKNSSLLIVDPYGIPRSTINMGVHEDLRSILPYFGPVDQIPEFAKPVYLKGLAMDDWGTRNLPPGFHP